MLYLLRKTSDSESLTAALKKLRKKYDLSGGQCRTILKKFDKLRINTNRSQINTWCKYSVGNDGVYTLKIIPIATTTPVVNDTTTKVAQYAQDVAAGVEDDDTLTTTGTAGTKEINAKHISLVAYNDGQGNANSVTYVYGNEDSVYINVTRDKVDVDDNTHGTNNRWIIDDVDNVTVGVKNVDLLMTNLTQTEENYINPTAEIYTLYNNKGIVIAAVTIGEDNGTTASYAYITGAVDREEYGHTTSDRSTEGKWTWYRNAIVDGEKTRLTQTGDAYTMDLDELQIGEWYEIKYTANGDVRRSEGIGDVATKDNYKYTVDVAGTRSDGGAGNFKFVNGANLVETAVNQVGGSTVLLHDQTTVDQLRYSNGILYTASDDTKGLHLRSDVKTVLGNANRSGSELNTVTDGYNGYTGVEKAIKDMNCQGTNSGTLSDGTKYIELSVLLVDGFATVVVINDKTPAGTDGTGTLTAANGLTASVNLNTMSATIEVPNANTPAQTYNRIKEVLAEYGYVVSNGGISYSTTDGASEDYYEVETRGGDWFDVTVVRYYSIKVDGKIVDWVLADDSSEAHKTINLSSGYKGTNYRFQSSVAPASGGFKNNNSYDNPYASHGTPITADTTVINSDVTITTGYVKVPTSVTSGTQTATDATVSGTVRDAAQYVKVGSSLKVDVTVNDKDSANTTAKIGLTLDEADAATVSADQTLTAAQIADGPKTLTFTISNIQDDFDYIYLNTSDVIDPHTVIVHLVDESPDGTETKAGDVVATLSGGKVSADTSTYDYDLEYSGYGEGGKITVTIRLTGTAAGTETLTLSNEDGTSTVAWDSSARNVGTISTVSTASDTLTLSGALDDSVTFTINVKDGTGADENIKILLEENP